MLKLTLILAISVFVCLAAAAQSGGSAGRKSPQASTGRQDWRAIHSSAIVVDTHADTMQNVLDDHYDLADNKPNVQISLDKARTGNLGAEFFAIWVDPSLYKGRYVQRALDLIDTVYQQAARHPDQMVMAFSAEDIVRARTGPRKRLAALMGVEGGHAIDDDLGVLRNYYRLGVRYMTLTWSNTNDWADSSGDIADDKIAHHSGLTDFGVEVVREMNRLGMMVDISHVSDRTFYKTLVVSRAPVIASHSASRALCDSPRNLTDDMLRALARNGGVADVNFFSGFVDENFRNAFAAMKPERDAAVAAAQKTYRDQHDGATPPQSVTDKVNQEFAAKLPRPPLKSLIDQIDHMVKVAGIDHVGLGSDFDGVSGLLPDGIDSAADLPKITEALVARGYAAQDIDKILGGNFLRVFREVEQISRELQKEKPLGAAPLSGPELTR
jgi:membrane dipeptidase